ncbi:C-type lectin domain family 4 member F [Octodon degus]|uniref:C-type lectin domain family 4 member F n=1 Tax=Octodon degus TaxID=10160 RepID=A0A6P6EQ16_OCTDE|nr:C-type lectin domain family 4 member F [Octodon degus]
MDGEIVHFFKDNEFVSLHTRGMDPVAVTPAPCKLCKPIQAAMIVTAVIIVSSLVALFVVGHYHCSGLQEFPEAIQIFKSHIDNSSTWLEEIQNLKRRVDSISAQIQGPMGHLGDTRADIQVAKGALQEARALSWQTQQLGSSLERASAEIQQLKEDMGKMQDLAFQTHGILQNPSEKTSVELHKLSQGLESVSSEVQMLKAGLEMANTQARLANSSLKNANSEIYALRGHLDSFNDLRTQNQVLRSGLEGAQAEIQKLGRNLQSANALNSQTEALLRGSLDNTSAEILVLRGHLERTGDEMHLFKRDLETVTAQTQLANGHLEQTDAQIQMLKAELGNASALNSQVQLLQGQLKNVSGEVQTLKQEAKDTAALSSQMQMLGSSLQKASTEMQRLKENLENNKTEEQSQLETLREAIASQEQLQRTQNQLLQLILQGWKIFAGNLYYFSNIKKPWHEAEKFCVSQGAHLTSVTSEEEQAFLVRFTSTLYHWIGLTDAGTEGSWSWTDGSPFNTVTSKKFWDKNQPDNWQHQSGETEDCVHIQKKWNDISCSAAYHWVCKKATGQAVA